MFVADIVNIGTQNMQFCHVAVRIISLSQVSKPQAFKRKQDIYPPYKVAITSKHDHIRRIQNTK